ncbi:molybdopterin oxidoreductase family protein [Streptomyces acidicola]|uniref:molybdopterin oxidoreductase family protein n=1 Tax=Streptomyces acidicola TaxID=2596892 RepID=UPI003795BD88
MAHARLTRPLVRDSRDEPFRQVDWDDALTRVAQGLSRACGASGVLSCARAPHGMNHVAQKFARVVMGTDNVGSCNLTCHTPTAERTEARLRPNAGTDIPMAHAIGREIIRAGLADHTFIERATTGFEEYRQLVEDWTLSLAEKVTGVPASAIRELAHAYARGERGGLCRPPGVTEHHNASDSVGALINLSLLVGHVGRYGSGLQTLRGQDDVRHGLKLTEMFEAMEEGTLKAVYCIGEDLAQSAADGEQAVRRLRALDFLVVQDTFLTKTAELADVVLPSTAGPAEADGTTTGSEQRVPPVHGAVTLPGEARDGIDILCDVAVRLGHDGDHAYAETVRNELRSVSSAERDLRVPFGLVPYDPPVDLTDERYPIRLTTGRRLDESYNTRAQAGSFASPLRRGEYVELCPEDAEHHGVVVGEEVRIATRRGSMVAPVWVDTALRPGLAFMTMRLPDEVDAGRLTQKASCPIAGTAEFKASAIRIEKLPIAAVLGPPASEWEDPVAHGNLRVKGRFGHQHVQNRD